MPCPYCRHDQIVYVHGHGQCAKCGINIEPCCDGGVCEPLEDTLRPEDNRATRPDTMESTDSR